MNQYNEYKELGLRVIPIKWNVEKKEPVSHRNWSNASDLKLRPDDNGLMIKTGDGWGCLDFDLKNTKDKDIFKKWMNIVTNEYPEVLYNLFIEQTRNDGYHVWMQYPILPTKTSLAESPEGSEVIALYANGPVVYTYPTPGYTEFHQSMADVRQLTNNEFEYLIGVSQFFNEYKPEYDPNKKAINYPPGYEKELAEFDNTINDESFINLLHEIGLYEISDFKYNKKDKFLAFRRAESKTTGISAKVYFKSRKVMIFSASMVKFPNWHNRHEYPVWSLPPSFILFYHLNRDWENVIKRIGIKKKTTSYPAGIFPDVIEQSIFEVAHEKSLHPEFLFTAGLFTISSLAGNCYESDLPEETKNILFAIMIAPVSVGKTPAFKTMCESALKELLNKDDAEYKIAVNEWNLERAAANARKEPFNKPYPKRFHPFAVDGTTEGYVALMQDQEAGMGVYHDEAETILNAGAHKANNDAISFFTQAFSGGRYTQIRADRAKERVVKSLNISLLMGTQPSRLKNLFGADRIESGFAARFLMVSADYLDLIEDADPFALRRSICQEWIELIKHLYRINKEFCNGSTEPIKISLENSARPVFVEYWRQQRKDANERKRNKLEQYIMGAEAKMSAYFPRFCHIIAIAHNPLQPVITDSVVGKAWALYRWYADSTVRILGSAYNETETGLPSDLQLLFDNLPARFTTKEAETIAERLNLKPDKFKNSMRFKYFKDLFRRIAHGQYEKM